MHIDQSIPALRAAAQFVSQDMARQQLIRVWCLPSFTIATDSYAIATVVNGPQDDTSLERLRLELSAAEQGEGLFPLVGNVQTILSLWPRSESVRLEATPSKPGERMLTVVGSTGNSLAITLFDPLVDRCPDVKLTPAFAKHENKDVVVSFSARMLHRIGEAFDGCNISLRSTPGAKGPVLFEVTDKGRTVAWVVQMPVHSVLNHLEGGY